MTRNTHLNYKTLLGVARSSVQFEVSPSQEGLPKQIAQDVGSSLLRLQSSRRWLRAGVGVEFVVEL